MPRYFYDPKRPFAENKRRAIELHSAGGPPVALTVGNGWDSETCGFLFPTGATLDPAGGSMPGDVPDGPPGPGSPWAGVEWDAYRTTLRRRALYWQLRAGRAGKAFDKACEEALRSPGEDVVRNLERLLAELQHCRAHQARADATLAALVPAPAVPAASVSAQRVALERHIGTLRARAAAGAAAN